MERTFKKTDYGYPMILAIDFDGTVVEHAFPGIGKPMPGAIETLKELYEHYKLILWTCRTDESLEMAIEWLEEQGLKFDAYNANIDRLNFADPKILANIYIDDRNFGGFPGWDKIKEELL